MLIAVYHSEKILDRWNSGLRIVPVPLEIRPHPIDLPELSAFDVRGLCNRNLNGLVWTLKSGAEFEDFNTLAFKAICKIKLRPNMRRRPPGLNEPSYRPLKAMSFMFR